MAGEKREGGEERGGERREGVGGRGGRSEREEIEAGKGEEWGGGKGGGGKGARERPRVDCTWITFCNKVQSWENNSVVNLSKLAVCISLSVK